MSLSYAGLQNLLNICYAFAQEYHLIFNAQKSICMCIKPNLIKFRTPCMYLGPDVITFENKVKYLGIFISENGSCNDTDRQLRKLFIKSNMISRHFSKCSYDVKCQLFNSYCASFYGAMFWHDCTQSYMYKLKSAYNNCLRRILHIPKWCSATQMFATLNVLSFDELMRKCI